MLLDAVTFLRPLPTRISRIGGALAAAVLLGNCSTVPMEHCGSTVHAATLGKPFEVKACEPWRHTGIILQKGSRYEISSRIGQPGTYQDSSFPCSPDRPLGLGGKLFDCAAREPGWLNPLRYFGPGKVKHLRVLRDSSGQRASFLTLIAAIGADDSRNNVQVVGSHRVITARTSGELVLFANDWPGLPEEARGQYRGKDGRLLSRTYSNNRGALEVTVTRAPARE
jgi:hypothetical protein